MSTDPCKHNSDVAPGWVGGFAEKYPEFAYPNPDLSDLPMLENRKNIKKLQRMQKVIWPEFTWETDPKNPDPKLRRKSRSFRRFVCDISRLGYDNHGQVWSLMCPQQGFSHEGIGTMNIEVTVTGQRGWVNEVDREFAVDMTVVTAIWFAPSAHGNSVIKSISKKLESLGLKSYAPLSKETAIKIKTHKPGSPGQATFPGQIGQSKGLKIPSEHQHWKEAWAVGNVEVEIGKIEKTGHWPVDWIYSKIMDIYNGASGNMLLEGNVLTWNLWFAAPEKVDTKEWEEHSNKWLHSKDVDHGAPMEFDDMDQGSLEGDGSFENQSYPMRLVDGSLFEPNHLSEEDIENFIKEMEELLQEDPSSAK